MLFNYLNNLKNNTNDEDFREILKMVEDDIKFNRTSMGKKTSTKEFIKICEITKEVYARC